MEQEAFAAAGVLPYALVDGQVLILLGLGQFTPKAKQSCSESSENSENSGGKKRPRSLLVWSDFGGVKENDEDQEATAAREFAEETFGLFYDLSLTEQAVAGSARRMEAVLRDESLRNVSVFSASNGTYRAFLAPVQYVDVLMFNAAVAQTADSEKLDFAWVPAHALFAAIEACREGGHRNARLAIGRRRSIHLFHKFVITLLKMDLSRILRTISPVSSVPRQLGVCHEDHAHACMPAPSAHAEAQNSVTKRKLGLMHPVLVTILMEKRVKHQNSKHNRARARRRKRAANLPRVEIVSSSPSSACT
jgi:hypothetical protein